MLGKIKTAINNYIKRVAAENAATKEKASKKQQRDFGTDISSITLNRPNIEELLKMSFQKSAKDFAVNYNGQKQVAMDSAECETATPAVDMNGTSKDIIYTFFSKFGFIGWQQCALLAQHWLISNACSIPAKDAIRNGWINTFADADKEETIGEDKEKEQKFLNELNEITNNKFKLSEKAIQWITKYNIFGIGIALPKIDGIKYDKPYNPDGIKKGSFKGITIMDPYWLTPQFDQDVMVDPTNPNFYKPTYYLTAKGEKIHVSHFIIIRRKEVPDILKPSYYFGGIPLTQEIYERVYAAEKSANEQPLLLLTKRVNGWKVDLNEFFLDPKKYEQRIRNFTDKRDNQGVLLIDHEDDMFQIDTSLSDLDEVVMSQYKLVAAVARIPVDKLFELNPSGTLSNSGDFNIKNYTQDLNTIQNDLYKPFIDRINEIVMRSYYGRKDKIAIVFNPTDNPTAQEQATNVKTEVDTLQALIGNNVITTEEARQKLISDKRNGFSFLDEEAPEQEQDNEEIEQMMKEQQNKQQQGKDEDIEWHEEDHPRKKDGTFAKKENSKDSKKLSNNDKIWIEEKLYALNKKAKEYRGYGGKYKDELYDIKNKILNKYGKKTGKIHRFNKGIGIEYSIGGLGSFHNYIYNEEDYINKENLEKIKTIKKEDISEDILDINFYIDDNILSENQQATKLICKVDIKNEKFPFNFEIDKNGKVKAIWGTKNNNSDKKEEIQSKLQKNIDNKDLLTEEKILNNIENLGEISAENKRNIDLTEEDIEKLKNFAEDKGINDVINILFAINNKIYEIEEKSKAEDTDWITVHPHGKETKGVPVPVEEGQGKGEAIKQHFARLNNPEEFGDIDFDPEELNKQNEEAEKKAKNKALKKEMSQWNKMSEEEKEAEREQFYEAEEQQSKEKNKEKQNHTLVHEKQILEDMGISRIRKPTPEDKIYKEYNDLSPRIKRYFFTDNKNALKWDEAQQILQEHKGNDTEDIFEYLRVIDLKTPQSRTNERTRNYLKGQQAEDRDYNRDEFGRFATVNNSKNNKNEQEPSNETDIYNDIREELTNIFENKEIKKVDFGELPQNKLEEINKLRQEENIELLQDNRLVIPAAVVKKLIDERIINERMDPAQLADLLIDVFHNKESVVAKTKYKHIQALIRLYDKISRLGFIAIDPKSKETVVKSGYNIETKRVKKEYLNKKRGNNNDER